jgi:hypothetical protein
VFYTRGETFDARDGVAAIAVEPDSAVVTIPDAHFLFTADFKRKGPDLVLTGERTGLTGDTRADTTTGTLTFTDVDLTNTSRVRHAPDRGRMGAAETPRGPLCCIRTSN